MKSIKAHERGKKILSRERHFANIYFTHRGLQIVFFVCFSSKKNVKINFFILKFVIFKTLKDSLKLIILSFKFSKLTNPADSFFI